MGVSACLPVINNLYKINMYIFIYKVFILAPCEKTKQIYPCNNHDNGIHEVASRSDL